MDTKQPSPLDIRLRDAKSLLAQTPETSVALRKLRLLQVQKLEREAGIPQPQYLTNSAHKTQGFVQSDGRQVGAGGNLVPHARRSMTPFPNLSHRFIKCSALLLLSAVLAVLLLKAFADGTSYDSSTSGLLNEHYTVRTTISNGTSSRSYEVTYKFFVDGIPYSGQSWLTEEPIEASAIVYYMAANPNDNSLHPTKSDDWKLALALGFLLISAVAYYRLPKDEPVQTRSSQAGYGDSAGEDMRMVRGTYDAYIYVHAAFLIQVILVGTLLIGLATFTSLRPMSYEVLAVATAASIVTSLWIFFDRWDCCEAFASNLCSGWAILSVLYVPFVTVIYANFRGLGKLFGR